MGRVLKPVSKISGVYGQPGEEKVSQVLSECLSDEYVILNSPRIYYHGATFDIDHVVIGPNGIFVIETKNMQGTIIGGLMGNWSQYRNRASKNKVARIGNPANQVNQYGKVVRSHLKSRYAHETGQSAKLMIYPIVVFVHEDIDLSQLEYTKPGYVGRTKVVKLEELCEYILRREAITYKGEDVDLFAELLVPPDHRDQTSYFSLDTLNSYSESQEGRYEIYEELGRGNYGVVFRGFDYKLDKEIAIKKLQLNNNTDSNAIGRFYREAQIASSLNHENIIAVYDYYESKGEYYIVMEMVEGQTLDKYAVKKFTVKEALRIFRQICTAVAFAHQKHVVHRDIKPSNIMMDTEGIVKVTDFGIAKLMNETDLTMERGGFGTPTVMAPEQINGREVTEKTDIFALGGLLYFLLTGKRPFEGEHIGEIIHKISYLDPPEMSRFNKEVSGDLESVVFKALEKRPEDRFEDVPQMIKSIDELLATGRLVTPIGRKRLYIKYIPVFLRPYIKTESSLISIITLASMLVFIGILGIQSYKDYRDLVNNKDRQETQIQYGFNNENAEQIFDAPEKYRGLPVDFVGRIEKVTNLGQNSTEFFLTFQSKGSSKTRSVQVIFNQPHFSLPLVANIEVSGSIQGATKDGDVTKPVIIADKISAVEDPWTVLAPSLFNVYPNMTVTQNGKSVLLEKIEFSQYETRLYVRIKNQGKSNDTIYLSDPVGKQGSNNIKEIKPDYGITLPQVFQLAPGQEAGSIMFLEPIDYKVGYASFTLGSSNDILSGQEPYKFEVKW